MTALSGIYGSTPAGFYILQEKPLDHAAHLSFFSLLTIQETRESILEV